MVQFNVCSTFSDVCALTSDCEATVVDIPMGIPSGAMVRDCDKSAKARLKGTGASSSLFFTPPRATLQAATPEEFQELHKRERNIGAGYPVWGIVNLIREADATLRQFPSFQRKVYEFHPELAWRRLLKASLESKATAYGALQRFQALNERFPMWIGHPPQSGLKGSGIALDDALDAAVGLFVAQNIVDGNSYRLPESDVPVDEHGLPMAIWY
jgi:predicted RNase H-like nuclease